MGNIAYTVDEQIALLKKRGLVINDELKAREILLDIGYYRLGFYIYHFQNKHNLVYNKNISLNDVLKLYYLDVDLKNLLSKYIYRIEVHFRTQIVYLVSNHYKENPTWYMDPKVVDSKTINSFHNIYESLKRDRVPLKKHHKKYDCSYAPAWKTFEFLTFGQVYKFYSELKDTELKQKIANVYGLNRCRLLENYFLTLIHIRNICSQCCFI